MKISHEKYYILATNVPGMIYQTGLNRSIEIITNSEAVCGFSDDEFYSGKIDLLTLIHPDDKQVVIDEVAELMVKPVSIVQQYRIVDKNGSIRWMIDHKRSVFNEDGSFQGVVGILLDSTERKQAEEQLNELATFPQWNPGPVVELDYSGRVTFINPSAVRLFPGLQDCAPDHPFIAGIQAQIAVLPEMGWEYVFQELQVGKQWYALNIHALRERSRIRIFAMNITERKKMENDLNLRTSELTHLSARLRRAREDERAMIARELHDEFGQALTAVKININRLESELMDQGTMDTIKRLRETSELTDRLLEQVRDLALNLRPSMLDDLGLVAALHWYVRGFSRRTGVECTLQVVGQELPLCDERRIMIFRAVQEALTNVVRHAEAESAGVLLRFCTDFLSVEVKDDGKGFNIDEIFNEKPDKYPIGLLGMRESTEELGGTCNIQSKADQGSCITITIPLENRQ